MTVHRPRDMALLDRTVLRDAAIGAVRKLDPRELVRNPVMCVTALVALAATGLTARGGDHFGTMAQISAWLWFTVLFANFAEAIAEGRGKAQAASLRRTKTDTAAKRLAARRLRAPAHRPRLRPRNPLAATPPAAMTAAAGAKPRSSA